MHRSDLMWQDGQQQSTRSKQWQTHTGRSGVGGHLLMLSVLSFLRSCGLMLLTIKKAWHAAVVILFSVHTCASFCTPSEMNPECTRSIVCHNRKGHRQWSKLTKASSACSRYFSLMLNTPRLDCSLPFTFFLASHRHEHQHHENVLLVGRLGSPAGGCRW